MSEQIHSFAEKEIWKPLESQGLTNIMGFFSLFLEVTFSVCFVL